MTKCEWKDHDHGPACGKPGYKDRSYCEDHVWLIYQKGTGLAPKKSRRGSHQIKRGPEVESVPEDEVEELNFH